MGGEALGRLRVAQVSSRGGPAPSASAGGPASITPASSKHSRSAATQKARPPESMPEDGTGLGVGAAAAQCGCSRIPVLGIDRAPGEDVGPGHELGGQVPAEHAHLDVGLAPSVDGVADQDDGGGVAEGTRSFDHPIAGPRMAPPMCGRQEVATAERGRQRARVDQRADGELPEALRVGDEPGVGPLDDHPVHAGRPAQLVEGRPGHQPVAIGPATVTGMPRSAMIRTSRTRSARRMNSPVRNMPERVGDKIGDEILEQGRAADGTASASAGGRCRSAVPSPRPGAASWCGPRWGRAPRSGCRWRWPTGGPPPGRAVDG